MNFQVTAIALLSSTATSQLGNGKLYSSFCSKGLQRYLHCYFHVQLGIQTFFCFPQWLSSTEFLLLLCFIFTDLVLFFLIRNLFILPVKNSFVTELACCGQYSGTAAGATAPKLLGRNMSQGSWLYLASPIATDITQTQIYKAIIETGVKLQPLQPKTSYRSRFKGIKLRVQPCGRSLRWVHLKGSSQDAISLSLKSDAKQNWNIVLTSFSGPLNSQLASPSNPLVRLAFYFSCWVSLTTSEPEQCKQQLKLILKQSLAPYSGAFMDVHRMCYE